MARQAAQRAGGVAEAEPRQGSPVQGVNKTEAVAQAMRVLGKRASNEDLIGYVQQKFGLEVGPQYLSTIKSNLKKRRRARAASAEVEGEHGQASQGERRGRRVAAAAIDPAELIRAVKVLAQRAGGLAALKRLVDALAE